MNMSDNSKDSKKSFQERFAPERAEAVKTTSETENNTDTQEEGTNPPQQLNQLEEENNSLKDTVLRLRADAENMRKRHKDELKDTSTYAITKFAKDIIEVNENFYRALESIAKIEKNESVQTVIEGIEMTQKTLINTLDRYDVKRVMPSAGEKFNHELHQAVSQIESPDHESGMIIDVIQAGYTLGDRLLRPAMVVVCK
jgi:molecular chaperone GrpE